MDNATKVYELLAKDHPSPDEFKLLLENVSPGVLAKRYLLTGLPFVFDKQPQQYLAFREATGRIFGVAPQQISVMGSARFGFSASPRKQGEDGPKELDQNSDMDLIIVSDLIYQRALEDLVKFSFSVLRNHPDLRSDPTSDEETVTIPKHQILAIRNRAKALHFGYVSPSDLTDGSAFKQEMYDKQREAQTQLFGTAPPGPINRIGARIYRDWEAAERAYEFSFLQLSRSLGLKTSEQALGPQPDEERPTEAEAAE